MAHTRRPLGAEHGLHASADNWLDRRKKKAKFEEEDPQVLIVGGGQNGLMLARNLGVLGISTLVVEKNCKFRFFRLQLGFFTYPIVDSQPVSATHGDVVTTLSVFTIP